MIENTYVGASEIHGQGLFAKSRIKSGTVIGWLQGRPCSEDGDYVLWISEQQGIEVMCNLKYINHSEQPNACYYDDLSVIALRDIAADEEITHNYGCNDW